MLWESGAASGEDSKGTDTVWTGNPRRRISHKHGEENTWIPDLSDFKAVPGILNPSEPIDNLIKAWGSILVTKVSSFSPKPYSWAYYDSSASEEEWQLSNNSMRNEEPQHI